MALKTRKRTKKKGIRIKNSKPLLSRKFGSSRCHPSVYRNNKTVKHCIPYNILQQLNAKSDKDALNKVSIEERSKLLTQYFRPEKPNDWDADPDMWLDNTNIAAVMKQYQDAYPNIFKFMGVFPIDFAIKDPYNNGIQQCLVPALCKLNLKDEIEKGIKGIGIIYNLDSHDKEGSHWVAQYVDLKNAMAPIIYYFDSYGELPPPYVRIFMEELWKTTSANAKPKLVYNARRFQYGNSECGMYSMYFIISMLQGINFKKFVRSPVADKYMIKLRDVLFFDNPIENRDDYR